MLPIAILSGSKNVRVAVRWKLSVCKGKKCRERPTFTCFYPGAVGALTYEKIRFRWSRCWLFACNYGRMRIYTHTPYTSYMIVCASTFRSILLLLWCYDVLRCPSKRTSCTYYIVVFKRLHVSSRACSLTNANGELFAVDRRRCSVKVQRIGANYDPIKPGTKWMISFHG